MSKEFAKGKKGRNEERKNEGEREEEKQKIKEGKKLFPTYSFVIQKFESVISLKYRALL
jgi:hypothetical protein